MARTPKVVEDRREQIIEAALRVFAQKGFDKATNKDIAQEASITPGLIYHYFKSKEELLKTALEGTAPDGLLRSNLTHLQELPPKKCCAMWQSSYSVWRKRNDLCSSSVSICPK